MPDLVYVYLTFNAAEFVELYGVRKRIKRYCRGKMYMEDIAKTMLCAFPNCTLVEVRLLTGRHVVKLVNEALR